MWEKIIAIALRELFSLISEMIKLFLELMAKQAKVDEKVAKKKKEIEQKVDDLKDTEGETVEKRFKDFKNMP